ncbi:MAG: malonyl-CoA decarboxylase family protein [Granulosicoccus sp.]
MSRISYLSGLLSSVFIRHENDAEFQEERSFAELCVALLKHEGQRSGNLIARGLLTRFANSTAEQQLEFFRMLATRFDINADQAVFAAQQYSQSSTAENLSLLMESVEPTRQELFRRLNCVSGATSQLVHMRALLLDACRSNPELERIDLDFRHLFRAWFNQGFLILREIDWHTPAKVLENIIENDAISQISNWSSLRNRLESTDQRCYAFFHPAMPSEPLIVFEIALTDKTPQSLSQLTGNDRRVPRESDATTAVFYSICYCQAGLEGISFGNSLVKQVVAELKKSLPELRTFRTLSPIPGLMRWVAEQLKTAQLNEQADTDIAASDDFCHGAQIASMRLAQVVSENEKTLLDEADSHQLKQLAAYYLLNARHEDNQPLDSVAQFHLGSGAVFDDVLPGADESDTGRRKSASLMASYLYDMDCVDDNQDAYEESRQLLASSEMMVLCGLSHKRVRKRMV